MSLITLGLILGALAAIVIIFEMPHAARLFVEIIAGVVIAIYLLKLFGVAGRVGL